MNIKESERLFYKDNHTWLFKGDCRSMYELPNECVQMVVTSPPYWGLRKYAGLPDLVWGDKDCEHEFGSELKVIRHRAGETNPGKEGYTKDAGAWSESAGNFCSLCGAWKGSYGLEPAPEMYIEHTIEILREIRRALRKDGVVFWNVGDSYAGSWGSMSKVPSRGEPEGRPPTAMPFDFGRQGETSTVSKVNRGRATGFHGLKPKDLCLIPFRVAIAAQEDGWWVRSVIIWSKPNPMPESVTDRPTESHEYILMLTKNAKYYWDADAVREEYTEPLNRWGGPELRESSHKYIDIGEPILGRFGETSMLRKGAQIRPNPSGRNIRSVWEFPTQPYPEAHFAVFPEKLPETCIKAATPEVGCCSKCGAPWERIKEPIGEYAKYLRPHRVSVINKRQLGQYLAEARSKSKITQDQLCAELGINSKGHGGMVNHFENGRAIPTPKQWQILKQVLCLDTTWDLSIMEFSIQEKEYLWEKDITTHHHLSVTLNAEYKTLGWRPTCDCKTIKPPVPSIVLDPFAGAGTTLWVAKTLGRKAVGYELSEEYCRLSVERNRQQILELR